jgi:hypothetical protein
MPKSKPPYPAAFRQQIIELARSGRTPAQASSSCSFWASGPDTAGVPNVRSLTFDSSGIHFWNLGALLYGGLPQPSVQSYKIPVQLDP